MNGVLFRDKHSYRNWGLFLKSRPKISPPSVKTVYVNIPGADGVIDLTESLTGDVKFDNRTIKLEFVVISARNRWGNIYSEIMNYLHGQKIRIVLDEDPTYYYIGRFKVNDWVSDKVTSTLIIEGNVAPYKLELFSSLEDWEWNSFNFETGIIRGYNNLEVDGELELVIEGRRMPVIPTFLVTSVDGLKLTFDGAMYNLQNGTNRVLNIVLKDGANTLKFTGNGAVSVEYRGGAL